VRYTFFEPGCKLPYKTRRYLPQNRQGVRMNEFIEFFESKGIKNIKNLTVFVQNFLKEPVIFFNLTEAQRNEMEQKMDEALAFFKD
jgi:hypothetical protein